MNLRYFVVVVCFCIPLIVPLFSISPPIDSTGYPWFTGPLITTSSRVVKRGHVNFEPYLNWSVINGVYDDNWNAISGPSFNQINPQLVTKFGLTDWMDFSFNVQSVYNWTAHASASGFSDLVSGLDIQLLDDKNVAGMPLKLVLFGVFPTGRYEYLKPSLEGTDSTGLGRFGAQVGLVVGKLFHFADDRYLNTRFYLNTVICTSVRVHGLNAYGGDETTRGIVRPGTVVNFFSGAEYTLTHNWVLAIDVLGTYKGRNRFKGSSLFPVGGPEMMSFVLAPAIEYNWNSNVGVIVGSVFTVAGKNTARMRGASAALNWYY